MPNSFFRFRQFVVHQERCAMKVGTDSVLLGAWAKGGRRVLDVGSGTGVIAMMMAQRFRNAAVDAVDIEAMACEQALENIAKSPFAGRISVFCSPIQEMASDPRFQGLYDAVVSNPPFFENALKAPEAARNMARHTDSLSFADLFGAVRRLMSPDGEFSVIIPFDYLSRLQQEAALNGLVLVRKCAVKTTPRKMPKRFLVAFRFRSVDDFEASEEVLEVSPGVRSEWYARLTADFYL